MTPDEKQTYADAVALELMRAMQLRRKDFDLRKEEDAAVYSIWYLLNPLPIDGRDRLELTCEARDGRNGKRFFRFTAHAHRNEPLVPSPDDMLIYDREHRNGKRSVHYIVDRFRIRKVL